MRDPMDNDEFFIGYCELHCRTPRALFIGAHVNRMLSLAGFPEHFPNKVPDDVWGSVHEDMEELCSLARKRLKESK